MKIILDALEAHEKKAKQLENLDEDDAPKASQGENKDLPISCPSSRGPSPANIDVDAEDESLTEQLRVEARKGFVKLWCDIAREYYKCPDGDKGAAFPPIHMEAIRKAVSLLSHKVFCKGIMQDAPEFYEFLISLLFEETRSLMPVANKKRGKVAKRAREEADALDALVGFAIEEEWTCKLEKCKDRNKRKQQARNDSTMRLSVFALMSHPIDPFEHTSFAKYIRKIFSGDELKESRTCPSCGEGITVSSRVNRLPSSNVTIQLTWHKVPDASTLKRLLLEVLEDAVDLSVAFGRAMGQADDDEESTDGGEADTVRSKRGAATKDLTLGTLSGIVCFKNLHYVALILGQPDALGSRDWFVCEDAHQPVNLGSSWVGVIHWLTSKRFAPLILSFDVGTGTSNPSPRPHPEDIARYLKPKAKLAEDDCVVVDKSSPPKVPRYLQSNLTSFLATPTPAAAPVDFLASKIERIMQVLGDNQDISVVQQALIHCGGNVEACINRLLGGESTSKPSTTHVPQQPRPIQIPKNIYAPTTGNPITDAYTKNIRYTQLTDPSAKLPSSVLSRSSSGVTGHAARELGKSPQHLFGKQYYVFMNDKRDAIKDIIRQYGGSVEEKVGPNTAFGSFYLVTTEDRLEISLKRFLSEGAGKDDRLTNRDPSVLHKTLSDIAQHLLTGHVLSAASVEAFGASKGASGLAPLPDMLLKALKRAACKDKEGVRSFLAELHHSRAISSEADNTAASTSPSKGEGHMGSYMGSKVVNFFKKFSPGHH